MTSSRTTTSIYIAARIRVKQGEPLGRGKGEWGARGGGQYTANLGTEWTGTRATTQRRDFQVSEGRVLRSKGRDFQAAKRGCQNGLEACAFMYILC
jgi:hypothetical protein